MKNNTTERRSLTHVHPLNWWCGMKNPVLQVMLHGEGIGDCSVSLTEARGVSLMRTERVANPNYLFLYLDLRHAIPQTFGITLTKPGEDHPCLTYPYELKRRDGEMPTPFSSADVLYLLMPDRFIDGDPSLDHVEGLLEPDIHPLAKDGFGRCGGDLSGIAKSLQYLQELGVTAIWHTPVQINDMKFASYHGYAITDYYRIDPRLGTNEEYRQLVRECHRHGLKMVMDLVFNHCGSEHFLYRDLPQRDWFNFNSEYRQSAYRTAAVSDPHASDTDRLYTTDGWFVRTMPDFNQRNPLVKDYLIQMSIWWIEYAKVDGIRQDTYPYADKEMMAEWCQALDREYPGYNIVGETWVNNSASVAYWQKDSRLAAPFNSHLPTVMDFPLMTLLNQQADEETDDWSLGLARIYEYLTGDLVYENPDCLLTFLDNHDTDRFNKTARDVASFARYQQALLLLLTLRGTPQLYYGDELGMYSTKAQGDGLNRRPFPADALTAKGRNKVQRLYYNYTRRLLNWRKQNPAAQRGALVHFYVRQGCYVYSRTCEGRRFTVFLNGTSRRQVLPLEPYSEVLPTSTALDILSGKRIVLGEKLTLSPRKSLLLEFE